MLCRLVVYTLVQKSIQIKKMVFRPCKPKKKKVEEPNPVELKASNSTDEISEGKVTEPVEEEEIAPPKPQLEEIAQQKKEFAKKGTSKKGRYRTLTEAPSAKEAAFGGPPRYDWIDVETAAAVKVQSQFRRLKVMKELDDAGMTTSSMRNRARARKNKHNKKAVNEDVPFLVSMCGIGTLFGAYDDEEVEAERKQAEAMKRQEEIAEREAKNQARLHNFASKQKHNKEMLESLEVVEDVH